MDNIHSYYNAINEKDRLTKSHGELELIRSQEIVLRYLPKPPAVILDVGGAAGIYSCWLAKLGYEVHLIDPVESHVEQAKSASAKHPDHPVASCRVGDARSLDFPTDFADTVLMFGPMYHLTSREDRIAALREARRVLKSSGFYFGAYISRFASAMDGLKRGLVLDPEFRKILSQDLLDGQHRNHTNKLEYFTDSYFHLPGEIESEITESGMKHESTIPVEGIGYLLPNLDQYWSNESSREILLDLLRKLESEQSLLGAGSHLIGIGEKI